MAQGWVTKFYSNFAALPDGPLLGKPADVSVAPNGAPNWGDWPPSDPGPVADPGNPFWNYWEGYVPAQMVDGWFIQGGRLYSGIGAEGNQDLPIPYYVTNDWTQTGVRITFTCVYEDIQNGFDGYPFLNYYYSKESNGGIQWSEFFWEYQQSPENITWWREYGPFDGSNLTPPNSSLEFATPGLSTAEKTVKVEYSLSAAGVTELLIDGVAVTEPYPFYTGGYTPVPGSALYPTLSTDNESSLGAFAYLDVRIETWGELPDENFVEIAVQKLTADQYSAIGLKNTTSTFPFKFYDNEDYPQRTISVWPVPTLCHAVKLWLWQPLINATDLDTDIVFPQGYERALRFALAVELAAEFGKEVPPNVRNIAKMSKGVVKRLNAVPQILKGDIALTTRKSFNVITGDTIPNNS